MYLITYNNVQYFLKFHRFGTKRHQRATTSFWYKKATNNTGGDSCSKKVFCNVWFWYLSRGHRQTESRRTNQQLNFVCYAEVNVFKVFYLSPVNSMFKIGYCVIPKYTRWRLATEEICAIQKWKALDKILQLCNYNNVLLYAIIRLQRNSGTLLKHNNSLLVYFYSEHCCEFPTVDSLLYSILVGEQELGVKTSTRSLSKSLNLITSKYSSIFYL